VVKECFVMGVDTVTLFLFSTENWQRPSTEIDNIFVLLETYLNELQAYLCENKIVVKSIGQKSRLSTKLQELLDNAGYCPSEAADSEKVEMGMESTRTLCLALSYGGRDDIVEAAKSLASAVKDNIISIEDITEETFAKHTSTGSQCVSDPDLIIRTSGELRMSNFLLYQSAYAEFVSVSCLWPDLTPEKTRDIITKASTTRKRRFGGHA